MILRNHPKRENIRKKEEGFIHGWCSSTGHYQTDHCSNRWSGTAVGSATVAMTMAAGIVAAMPEIAGLSPLYLACVVAAVAGGATVCSHFNDSGFWLVRSLVGLDEKTTLKTWTIMETLVGGTGFI